MRAIDETDIALLDRLKELYAKSDLTLQIKAKTDERDAKIIVEQEKAKTAVMDEYAPSITALESQLTVKP